MDIYSLTEKLYMYNTFIPHLQNFANATLEIILLVPPIFLNNVF